MGKLTKKERQADVNQIIKDNYSTAWEDYDDDDDEHVGDMNCSMDKKLARGRKTVVEVPQPQRVNLTQSAFDSLAQQSESESDSDDEWVMVRSWNQSRLR